MEAWLRRLTFALCAAATQVSAANDLEAAADLRILHATTQSIGIEWDIGGDADHDATCTVRFREAGGGWRSGLPLMRIDYEYGADLHPYQRRDDEPRRFNMFAGSLLFLKPGTSYAVELAVRDPDGGTAVLAKEIKTRLVPALDPAGERWRVQGAEEFRAAYLAAAPGDVILLGEGDYGELHLDRGGRPGKYLAVVGEEGAVASRVWVGASHLWIGKLTVRHRGGMKGAALKPNAKNLVDVVVSRCRFEGHNYSIQIGRSHSNWHIADNTIIGDNDPAVSNFGGEGIEIGQSSGHVIAHNSISRTADPISSPFRNCDIYGNDIFDSSDDGFEGDNGYANNRIWGNSIRSVNNNALSFQPQFCGPWYFIRNHVVIGDGSENICKFNGKVDRNVYINNTFVALGRRVLNGRANALSNAYSRNNIFASSTGSVLRASKFDAIKYSPSWEYYTAPWRADLDYDGFAWKPGKEPAFSWLGVALNELSDFADHLGIEQHGVALEFGRDITPIEKPPLYILPPGSAGIDAGTPQPNAHSGWRGKAPDLGAVESGSPLPNYGPRGDHL